MHLHSKRMAASILRQAATTGVFARLHVRTWRARAFAGLSILILFSAILLQIFSHASAVTQVVFLTSGTSWTVPSDWNNSNNYIEAIGGGGGGQAGQSTGGVVTIGAAGYGGGGGAYSKSQNVTLAANTSVTVAIGVAGSAGAPSHGAGGLGGDTYLCNSTSNCASLTDTAVIVGAQGGAGGASVSTVGAGGAAASGVGSVKVSGGDGGNVTGGTGGGNGGGGGGAGGCGASACGSASAGAAGNSGNNQAGGKGDGTFGGAGGAADGAGSAGTEWDVTHGSGGGAGGGTGGTHNNAPGNNGAAAGAYGSGGAGGGGGDGSAGVAGGSGSAGQQGLIVITYVSDSAPAAPTLSTPASSATGVALAPSFTLRTTDADNDYLRYEIVLYQSDCSTVVATADQTASQTGWSGQNQQTGTAYTGSSTLASSTLATYTYQGTLSPGTTYCWKAAAIDPAGTNAFGSFSATQSFTTNSSPGAPTLSAPASGATGISSDPTFTLSATDAESDSLQYKIVLYQSDCSTLVATDDMTSSTTGWDSTSYASGATANYTYTSTLRNNTTYCWKAAAIDPAGTNTFGSYSATQNFTTTAVTSTNLGGGLNVGGGVHFGN